MKDQKIIYVCAWCGKRIGVVEPDEPAEFHPMNVSHGICSDCAANLEAEMEAELEARR